MDDVRDQRRLLIVNHELAVQAIISEKLRHAGFASTFCTGAEEAFRRLQAAPCDAIVAELEGPAFSGLQFLDTVSKRYPHISTILITNEANIRAAIEAVERGVDDFLVKPYELGGVAACVEGALHRRNRLAALEDPRLRLRHIVEERMRQFENLRRRIESTYDETLEALGAALDLRDTETEGHSRRVSRFSMEMARAFGCSGEELKHIIRGAYLHDIGKIGIPDSILLKPARLTDDETTVMQTHAWIGYELLRRIAFLAPAAKIVLTHQERYDGTGYPQGLAGEEIPLGSRFFAVADTLDAMTSDRPYRRALSFEAAREEITRQPGHQFAPEAVEVFLSLPETLWTDIRHEVEAIREREIPARSSAL